MPDEGAANDTAEGVKRRHAPPFRWAPPLRRDSSLRRAPWPARLPAIAGLVFCAVILWALLNNLVNPHYGASRYSTGWSLAAAAVVLLLLSALYLLLRNVRFPSVHRLWSVAAWTALWALLLAVQMRVAYAVRIPADWDSYAVYTSAAGLAQGTLESVDGYFQVNPNNLLLTLLVAAYFELVLSLGFSDLTMATAFLNGLVLFSGTVLTYGAARMLAGRRAAALTLLPSTVFLVLSPWAGVLYSDTAGVLFTSLVLCLLLAAARSSRRAVQVPLWILAGGIAAVGYGIKPTVVIGLVAAGITALCLVVRRRKTAVLLTAVAVVGGSFFIGHSLIGEYERRSPAVGFDVASNPHAMNPGHFLMVGSQASEGPHGPYYGAYSQADYLSTEAIEGQEEKFRNGVETYADRVAEMGPGGYLSFLNHKLLWVTGDGSFFSWGEGRVTADNFLSQDPADRGIQDLLGDTRPHFQWMLSIWQGTWFAVLALVALPLFLRTPRLLRPELSALRIALLGLLLFLLFFEARSRFLYLYAPYFIVLATVSFCAAADRLRARPLRKRLRPSSRHEAAPAPKEVIE